MPRGRPTKKRLKELELKADELQLSEDEMLDRLRAEDDLEHFIRLVHPDRILGHVHQELIRWWTREDRKSHQLVLLPRDHQKSAMLAYRVAWWITKHPDTRILYISATTNLASKQLYFIKQILTSKNYTRYWPEMVHPDEGKREKWTETEIMVDHPYRKEQNVRDPTVFIAGLTTTIAGMHCDIACLDDVVVEENAATKQGREKVATQVSYLASITGTGSQVWAVGTRYHPLDQYQEFLETTYDEYDERGNVINTHYLWERFERQVEDRGDGTGNFLWPRTQREDGKWFGFDMNELARKRAQYKDTSKFRAQYYNSPNVNADDAPIRKEHFQYYEPKWLTEQGQGNWFYNGYKLNIIASIDFAFSLKQRADYTSLVVLGVDSLNNYYVLDIARFKTNKINEYFEEILRLYNKWHFRKLVVEVTAAQKVIADDLRRNYIIPNGLFLTLIDHRPTILQGSKEERIQAALQSKYEARKVFHFIGGNCQLLEEELLLEKPPHDDVKDALATGVEFLIPPANPRRMAYESDGSVGFAIGPGSKARSHTHSRFGGIQ
jgi:hypothetical protein